MLGEPKQKAARVSKAQKVAVTADAQINRTLAAESDVVSEPWRTPVARIY